MKAAIAAQEAKVKATQSRVSTEYSGRFRTRAAIQRAAEEISDKVWHDRHVMSGRPNEGREAAKRIEKKYGQKNLGPYDDFELGVLTGRLYAIRWALGDEWSNGDT
jgi:hypothetical protein